MSENRNLNRLPPDIANEAPIDFPYQSLPDPISQPEFYAREHDDVESIATPFAHDELMRKFSERVSEEIWRDKNHDIIGREAMIFKFDEIDSAYELLMHNFVNARRFSEIQLSDPVSPEILQELAVLFELTNEREAILEMERERIKEEKIKRIANAHEFFLRGLVASVGDDEMLLVDRTKF